MKVERRIEELSGERQAQETEAAGRVSRANAKRAINAVLAGRLSFVTRCHIS